MSDANSIISLGDLTKPANTLIEKVSAAIGAIYEPYHVRRMAQAESDAEKIRTVAQIEVTELQQRAVRRFLAEEAKKQDNMESIINKALPELTEQARPQDVEDDWISHFFDKCRLISDEEMQRLWAKILAGEANSPGRFKKRTVDLLASLDKSDAILFSSLCRFGIHFGGSNMGDKFPLIYDERGDIYKANGLNFVALSHLENIGLANFDNAGGYRLLGMGQKGYLFYFDKRVWVQLPKPEDNDFKLGKITLTKAGKELAQICGVEPMPGFIEYLKEKWAGLGYQTEPQTGEASPTQQ